MKARFYIVLFMLCFYSCNENRESEKEMETATKTEIAFDEEMWRIKDDDGYRYRNEMLKDLMNNQELRALKRNEIIEFLGDPNRIDTNYLFYTIEQKRLGFWPLHTKTMVIELAQDSTVNWIKIHE